MVYGIMVLINPPDSLLMVVYFITADQIRSATTAYVMLLSPCVSRASWLQFDSQCCLCPLYLAKYSVVPFTRCSYAGMLPYSCETDRRRRGITCCYLRSKLFNQYHKAKVGGFKNPTHCPTTKWEIILFSSHKNFDPKK